MCLVLAPASHRRRQSLHRHLLFPTPWPIECDPYCKASAANALSGAPSDALTPMSDSCANSSSAAREPRLFERRVWQACVPALALSRVARLTAHLSSPPAPHARRPTRRDATHLRGPCSSPFRAGRYLAVRPVAAPFTARCQIPPPRRPRPRGSGLLPIFARICHVSTPPSPLPLPPSRPLTSEPARTSHVMSGPASAVRTRPSSPCCFGVPRTHDVRIMHRSRARNPDGGFVGIGPEAGRRT
ncbi:hypothetical protein C8Q79DRAFT_450075 [Trametes meyenii]|nr:hypothetical protein C8Q79DRAFT_450075 [Trametes meyenii]